MICYNHPEEQACGICKNCNIGICVSCTTDLGDGIACTASCVEDVRQLNTLINRNVKVGVASSSRAFIMPIFYIIIGASLLGVNLYLRKVDAFAIGFGIVLALYGIYSLYSVV